MQFAYKMHFRLYGKNCTFYSCCMKNYSKTNRKKKEEKRRRLGWVGLFCHVIGGLSHEAINKRKAAGAGAI